MHPHTVALFGEAEKGEFRTAYFCRNLSELESYFGHPPEDSLGLHFAIQALLYERNLIFFRVKEEGYSVQDYLLGLRILQNQNLIPDLSALCLPGVGDTQLIEASSSICQLHKSMLVISEYDLYDYFSMAKVDIRNHY